MTSEEMGVFSAQRPDNGVNSLPQMVFPESFTCGPPPQHPHCDSSAGTSATVTGPGPKTTRELTGYLNNHHYFLPQPPAATEFRGSMFADRWNSRDSSTPSRDGSEEDEEDEDDDDDNEDAGRVDVNDHNNINKVSNNSSTDNSGNQKPTDVPNFGSKEGNWMQCQSGSSFDEARNNGAIYDFQGSAFNSSQKEIVLVDNGCGFSGRKESSYSSEPGESLRAILSDPISGALMDDAVILPCGHSFGNSGVQHVIRMKACYNCAQPVSEESIAPNLSLRAAVQAFRREEYFHVNRPPKRRKERHEQVNRGASDSMQTDHPRGRGVHFPFAVADRVIIQGNKRTPPRFVGREAIVTTQCLNGWYVVKTLDNAESVKVQYRSLAKAPADCLSPQPISSTKPASWL
ncbi:unnamed protein product [Cuscuta epithymum]|uniref:U-box domain-containing protein n=1 Tax=Cuscuta epithymum TaxID=186058 RepID=A0AAV0EC04_9ASTE|nr:unnamed protein product [Cuscuta epithymum]